MRGTRYGKEFDNRQRTKNGSLFFTAISPFILFADTIRYGGFIHYRTI